ncbi:hypothetical protein ABL78_4900 [Leptomonas seymouri]|uniref:Uncharacterized protein n=1 Tax=Leptomonas seymouri TaxID=5684 RepID=A0A0N1I480_LEPSE|nr:hypothetical protein ABL78_4900 [Leptomonas seymouri]|eukprot:KPI86031.1 hypothetical protein ABL78_4900 [Leptomonas seymouri]
MATVYLLDVSCLGSPSAHASGGAPDSAHAPLSWWCAGELAQWSSAVALRDAWAAANLQNSPSPARIPASSNTCDRSTYISLSVDDAEVPLVGEAMEAAPTKASSSAPSPYHLSTFPSTVFIQNKYFGITLTLVTGFAAAASNTYSLRRPTQQDISAALAQATQRSSSDGAGRRYGGVLLADVRQDPAEVPWHALSCSGGCLFRVITVFLEDAEDVEEIKSEATTELHLQSLGITKGRRRGQERSAGARAHCLSLAQRERWQYFAVENGYECVFHGPLVADNAGTAVQLEVVSTASGRRGLLEAPLCGSNRLYQILANTLWPADVRSAHIASEKGAADPDRTAQPTQQSTDAGTSNTFIVVGNNAHTVAHLFQQTETPNLSRTRRQLRFFTKLVQGHASDDGGYASPPTPMEAAGSISTTAGSHSACGPDRRGDDASRTAVVLVNKYYAAVVQPRLLQTAFFSVPMQDMLERYWEQHFADKGSPQCLSSEAPAIVLWPPSPPSSLFHGPGETGLGGSREAVINDSERLDVRSDYPPLESILDALKHRGSSEIVVVTPAYATRTEAGHPSSTTTRRTVPEQPALSLTPYELSVCAGRCVEVVDLTTPHCAADAAEDTLASPVLFDEDDVCATRALDRLNEILHCVSWGRSYLLPLTPSNGRRRAPSDRKLMASSQNTCLLLAYGLDAFQEEAWMCDVVKTLRPSRQPCPESIEPLSDDVKHLVAAAPSIAAVLDAPANARLPSCLATLTNKYFTTQVRLYLSGGLWAHYHSLSKATARRPSLPPDWLESYDGYVVVTCLHALQEASAKASSAPPSSAGASSELIHALSAILPKAEGWMMAQQTSGLTKYTAESADTPLTLLYVADVNVSDVHKTALVDACLRTIAKAVLRSDGEEEELFLMPVEVVFAAETSANVAAARHDTSVDGLHRVKEALEQHLWPHRQGCQHQIPASLNSSGISNLKAASADRTTPCVPEREKACAAAQSMRAEAQSREVDEPPYLPPAPPAGMIKPDTMWIGPTIGCALPSGFLIDPETLKSVPLRPVGGIAEPKRRAARVTSRSLMQASPVAENCCGMNDAARGSDVEVLSSVSEGDERENLSDSPPTRLPHAVGEEELMVWMEKMKMYGHRLGEAQRKQQAAALALALEALL